MSDLYSYDDGWRLAASITKTPDKAYLVISYPITQADQSGKIYHATSSLPAAKRWSRQAAGRVIRWAPSVTAVQFGYVAARRGDDA